MSGGCRDCRMCTEAGLGGRKMARGLLHLSTGGMSLLAKKAATKTCPQCGHRIAVHGRDEAGRFKD